MGTAVAVLCGFIAFLCGTPIAQAQSSAVPSYAQFGQLIARFASEPSDDCFSTGNEDFVFDSAESAVAEALNSGRARPATAVSIAMGALEHLGDNALPRWPMESRFHFRFLDLGKLVVVEFTLRGRTAFAAYGVPQHVGTASGPVNTKWMRVGHDRFSTRHGAPHLDIYGVHTSPSGHPRFLAAFKESPCGKGMPLLEYDGYEWDPAKVLTDRSDNLNPILNRNAVLRLGEPNRFGRTATSGDFVKLPYCRLSAIDTEVDATLCSMDTWDVSGDLIRFVGTEAENPDLDIVARVIEYAQAGDLPAVRAYTVDDKTAQSVMQQVPFRYLRFLGINVKRIGTSVEAVTLADADLILTFVLGDVNGRWLVTEIEALR